MHSEALFDGLADISWATDAHTHVNLISSQVSDWLHEHCGTTTRGPRSSYVTDATWQLRGSRLQLQRRMRPLRDLIGHIRFATSVTHESWCFLCALVFLFCQLCKIKSMDFGHRKRSSSIDPRATLGFPWHMSWDHCMHSSSACFSASFSARCRFSSASFLANYSARSSPVHSCPLQADTLSCAAGTARKQKWS